MKTYALLFTALLTLLAVPVFADPTSDGFLRADKTRWPNLWRKDGKLFYLDQRGTPQPLTINRGRITLRPNYYPRIENEVLAYYESLKEAGHQRWQAIESQLPPVLAARVGQGRTRTGPVIAPPPVVAKPSHAQPSPVQGQSPAKRREVAPPAQTPPASAVAAGTFPYFNPLPYPQKFKDCEAKHLTGKCVDGSHYALMGDLDHTICSSSKFTAFGHTDCFARARFAFESCIADEEVVEPKCTSLANGQEPNIRKQIVRNCKAKLLDSSCRDGVALETMQCEGSIKELAGQELPPLRATNDDGCVSSGRMGFMMCLIGGRVDRASDKPLSCRRVGKDAPPEQLKTINPEDVAARYKQLISGKQGSEFGREYVDFAHRKNLTLKDYRVFESCLISLFSRNNVVSFPRGNPSFVVITKNKHPRPSPLQLVHDQARRRPDCRYLIKQLTTWDATYKVHDFGPWGVAHEDDNVINSDFM